MCGNNNNNNNMLKTSSSIICCCWSSSSAVFIYPRSFFLIIIILHIKLHILPYYSSCFQKLLVLNIIPIIDATRLVVYSTPASIEITTINRIIYVNEMRDIFSDKG